MSDAAVRSRFSRRCSQTAVLIPLKLKSNARGPRPVFRRARGKRIASCVAVACQLVDQPPAGVAETEDLGDLVERLAGGVVARGTESSVAAEVLRQVQAGVAARNQQGQVRKLHPAVELHGQQMAFEVVDADER